jgi:hypothetical protein
MIGIYPRSRGAARVVGIAAVTAAMSVGVAACGGSDDDDAGSKAKSGDSTTQEVVADTPKQAIRGAYGQLVDAVYAKDARRVCEELTAHARKRFGEEEGCVKRFQTIFRDQKLSSSRPEIVSMKVNGQAAEAMIKTGESRAYPVQFVKRDGIWKVDGGWLGDES